MADFSDRNTLKSQLQSAAEFARLYNVQQGSQLYTSLLASTMMNGRNGLANRKPSFQQQQQTQTGYWDELIRQHRALLSRSGGGAQNFGMTNYERELAAMQQLQTNANLLAGAGLAWPTGLAGGGDASAVRQRSLAGSTATDLLGIWSSNADHSSISSRKSYPSSKYSNLGASVEAGANKFDFGGGQLDAAGFDFKDGGVMFERDSNANVVAKNPMDKSGGLTNESSLRKIWDNADPVSAQDLPQIGGGFSGFKSPAFGNLSKWSTAGAAASSRDVTLSGSDSDEEFAIKSKHFRRARKASLMSNGSVEDGEDQYGLRALLKNVKDLPSGSDTSEESDFVARVSANFPAPVFNYAKSPFSNQVVSPLCDSYDCPEEYANITTMLSKRLNGPHQMMAWPTELLFFYFYAATGDVLQILAANLLHNRGWRYSKSRGYWIARKKDTQPEFKSNTCESGYYQYFNVNKWTREYKYMTLDYNDLADYINIDEAKLVEASQFACLNPFAPRVAKPNAGNRESASAGAAAK